jgi:beta-lactamase superfamily II metal-dependent hydrolase
VSVVSSGKDNQFGHPNAAVVTRLAAYGAVLNTADVGAVHFSSDGQRIWVSAAR